MSGVVGDIVSFAELAAIGAVAYWVITANPFGFAKDVAGGVLGTVTDTIDTASQAIAKAPGVSQAIDTAVDAGATAVGIAEGAIGGSSLGQRVDTNAENIAINDQNIRAADDAINHLGSAMQQYQRQEAFNDTRAMDEIVTNKFAIEDNKDAILKNATAAAEATALAKGNRTAISAVEEHVYANSDALRQTQKGLHDLTQSVATNSDDIEHVGTQVDELNTTVDGIQETLGDTQADLDALKHQAEQTAGRAATNSGLIAQTQAEQDAFETAARRAFQEGDDKLKATETQLENRMNAQDAALKASITKTIADANRQIVQNQMDYFDPKIDNLAARRISATTYFDSDRYQRLITQGPGADDNLRATYQTYIECTTGQTGFVTKDGLQIMHANPEQTLKGISVERRLEDCMALQAWMSTPEDDEGRHFWKDVQDEQIQQITAISTKIAESHAEFGWGGVLDEDIAGRYSALSASEVRAAVRALRASSHTSLEAHNQFEDYKTLARSGDVAQRARAVVGAQNMTINPAGGRLSYESFGRMNEGGQIATKSQSRAWTFGDFYMRDYQIPTH